MAKRKTPSVSTLIAAKRERIKDTQRDISALRTHADGIRTVLSMLAPLARKVELETTANVWTHHDVEISLTAYALVTVDSMKDKALADLLEIALTIADSSKTNDYATEHYAQRTFRFARTVQLPTGANVELRIDIAAELKPDGDTCRRVQVGTKLVEEKIYAIACD